MSKQTDLINIPDAITVSGSNVGIGTSSPSADLDIKRTAGDNNDILRVGSTDNFYFGFARSNTTGALSIQGNQTNYNNILLAPTGGNVGIGTSSPSEKLDVSGNIRALGANSRVLFGPDGFEAGIKYASDAALQIASRTNETITFTNGNDGAERMRIASSGNVGINGNPDSGRKLHIEGNDASVGITLKDTAGGQFGIYSEDGNLDFKSDSANTVRMRIRGDGNIDIGSFSTTGASDGVQINPTGSGARSSSDATGFSYHYRFYNPNGQCGYIMTNGSNTSFVTSSDYRLKENVVDLTGASARVNQLNPSRFNFIADGTDTVVDGFIAHEVATVVPEAIAGTHNEVEVWKDDEELPDGVSAGDNKLDDDGNTIPVYQGIDQSKLVPLLTAALQEALTEIASLKTRVEALEA